MCIFDLRLVEVSSWQSAGKHVNKDAEIYKECKIIQVKEILLQQNDL